MMNVRQGRRAGWRVVVVLTITRDEHQYKSHIHCAVQASQLNRAPHTVLPMRVPDDLSRQRRDGKVALATFAGEWWDSWVPIFVPVLLAILVLVT